MALANILDRLPEVDGGRPSVPTEMLDVYNDQVARLRELTIFHGVRERQPPKQRVPRADATGAGKGGPILEMARVRERGMFCCDACGPVNPKSERWRKCVPCNWKAIDAFMTEAEDVGFPDRRARGCDKLEKDLEAAIHFSLNMLREDHNAGRKSSEPGWRRGQQTALQEVASALAPLDAWVKAAAHRPLNVIQIAKDFGVVVSCAIIDATREEDGSGGWPDTELPWCMLMGFPITGKIPSSGLFRLRWSSPPEKFDETEAAIWASNEEWNRKVVEDLSERGRSKSKSTQDDIDTIVEMVEEEVRLGLMERVGDIEALDARFGVGNARSIMRFIVKQGDKNRGCDDCNRSSHNQGTLLNETYIPVTADVSVDVAMAVCSWHEATAENKAVPVDKLAIGMSKEDIKKAYRFAPNSEMRRAIVAIYHPRARDSKRSRKKAARKGKGDTGGVVFYAVRGLPFGLTSAVIQFNRIPQFTCMVARRYMSLWTAHYYDDFGNFSLESSGASSQAALVWIHDSFIRFALAAEKRVPWSQRAIFLGIRVDFSKVFRSQHLILSPTRSRCVKALAILDECKAKNHVGRGVSSSLLGKVGFMSTSCCAWIGRFFTLVLVNRIYRDTFFGWTPEFTAGRDFLGAFTALDDWEKLPLPAKGEEAWVPPIHLARRVRVAGMETPPVHLYTDAMFEGKGTPDSPFIAGLGAVIVCPGLLPGEPEQRYYVSAQCPNWLLQEFMGDGLMGTLGSSKKKRVICQLEGLAALSGIISFAHLIRNRRVSHFIDNTAVLSAVINGYSGKRDLMRLVSLLQLGVADLQSEMWFDYVCSRCNIADVPSRLTVFGRRMLEARGFKELAGGMIFPSRQVWTKPELGIKGLHAMLA